MALERQPGIEHRLIATGQHRALFHGALAEFGLAADLDLALPNPDVESFCAALERALAAPLARLAPDLVLVQGDTSSALAAARAAVAAGVPLGHVEAGLRSGEPNLPWPEEHNRRAIDAIATLLFAPSAGAAANLRGLPGRAIVTGNTGIDALMWMRARSPLTLHDSAVKHILVTCHRREAIPRLPAVQQALLRLAERPDVRLHLPVHPNPAIAPAMRAALHHHPRIMIEDALPYSALVRLLLSCDLLLTDSGGLQEEAPALGLPTLVLRDISERPEVIASGNARLVGLDPDRIVGEATRLLDDPARLHAMARPAFPYGNGDAAARITDAILAWRRAAAAFPQPRLAPPKQA